MSSNKLINKIMFQFIEIAKCGFKYSSSEESNEIDKKTLQFIIDVYGKESENLFNDCYSLIEYTYYLKTANDAHALNLEDLDSNEQRIALELKSSYLLENKIKVLNSFYTDNFLEDIYKEASRGIVSACKMLAILNYYGLGTEKNFDTALSIWNMLALTGDEFAMASLKYLYKETGNEEETKRWEDIISLYDITKKTFVPVITNIDDEKYNTSVKNTVEIILSVKNRTRKAEDEKFDLPLLYYLVNTEATHREKINSICKTDSDGYVLLLREKYFKDKKYGF